MIAGIKALEPFIKNPPGERYFSLMFFAAD
jgi:hypothetical protein